MRHAFQGERQYVAGVLLSVVVLLWVVLLVPVALDVSTEEPSHPLPTACLCGVVGLLGAPFAGG